ncbi:immunoglobulin lambda-like polypeptide 1 [Chaetodon auriga]|uniref:immunoglobulin lambda-like polypeptide 1 n=1 Tax=Chaetodon auriga TaxID=39042 RepID=UPI004032EB0B
MDSQLTFEAHINHLCKTSFYHLRNISKLRPILSLSDAEKLVHAFFSSRPDYRNALLIGIPTKSLQRLQYMQNSAARILMRVQKHEHITPILHSLHWLSDSTRIEYKFVSLWWTFGGGTKLIIDSGSTVRPSVSLLPPSSEQLSGGSATLACLLSGYSPEGAVVSWEVDGTQVTEGVLSSSEEEKSGRYSSSSTLSLSKERWMQGELYSCKVLHKGHSQTQSLHRSQCQA